MCSAQTTANKSTKQVNRQKTPAVVHLKRVRRTNTRQTKLGVNLDRRTSRKTTVIAVCRVTKYSRCTSGRSLSHLVCPARQLRSGGACQHSSSIYKCCPANFIASECVSSVCNYQGKARVSQFPEVIQF